MWGLRCEERSHGWLGILKGVFISMRVVGALEIDVD